MRFFCTVLCLCCSLLYAADDAQFMTLLNQLSAKSKADRLAAYEAIESNGDPRFVAVLEAYAIGTLAIEDERAVIYQSRVEQPDGSRAYPLFDVLTAKPLLDQSGQQVFRQKLAKSMIRCKRPERRIVKAAVQRMQLNDPDLERRMTAIIGITNKKNTKILPQLEQQLAAGVSGDLEYVLKESIARLQLLSDDKETILAGIAVLESLRSLRGEAPLIELRDREQSEGGDAEIAQAAVVALARIESRQDFVRFVSDLFSGFSRGSILILLALGLSITFGLMGVINMAHGEMMMIGAYIGWGVSNAFAAWFPGAYDFYIFVAIPAAFLGSALLGMIIEWGVIRHLYERKLETLLATLGVSLILIQAVRVMFGDLQSVTAPSWLVGSVALSYDLQLPINRISILVFCVLVILAVLFILKKTRLGLFIRATTQNRNTASSLGVPTRLVDSCTFGLGSGLAGVAGIFVPLVDKINPQMGTGYIVDSFLVVVGGGVGNMAGVILTGIGLGCAEKWLEVLMNNPVFAKVTLMLLVIAFLYWKPRGLFPAKGRLAEA